MSTAKRDDNLVRWIWRGCALLVLVIGWLFILWHNSFHVTPSVVFASLGYFAGVSAIYTMFRTGASAVAEERETTDDVSWGRPLGARGELEREKRALLKAIKEAEFDLEMGKLSKADANEMISRYRAHAINVIKELEARGKRVDSVRDQIEREVRARLELDGKRKSGGDKAKAAKQGKKPQPKAASKAANKKAEAKPEPKAASKAEPKADEALDDKADDDKLDDQAAAAAEASPPAGDDQVEDQADDNADEQAAAPEASPPEADAKPDEPKAQEAIR